MLNIFAKRKLEKERQKLQEELTRLVPTKGVGWFDNYELVLINLREKFPNQITDVRALCCVVAYGISDLMSLPENIIDESKTIDLVHYIKQHSLPEETAQWAIICWADVLSQLPRSKRYEMAPEIKKREEAQRQAKAEREVRERQAEAEREEIRRQNAIEAKERPHLVACWRAAFASETAAIERAATVVQQEAIKVATIAGRAEADQLIASNYSWGWQERHTFTVYEKGGFSDSESMKLSKARDEKEKREKAGERKAAIERLVENKIRQDKNAGDIRPVVDDEIWRRIKATPDRAALHTKLEQAWQDKLQQDKIDAEQKRVEDEKKRVEDGRKRVLQQEQQKIKDQEVARQRVIDAEYNRKKMEREAAEKKLAKIRDYRKQFPLRCAGVSDDEVWKQINASLADESDGYSAFE